MKFKVEYSIHMTAVVEVEADSAQDAAEITESGDHAPGLVTKYKFNIEKVAAKGE